MVRALTAGCLIAALASSAWGDRLVLLDGRTFVGTVTVEGQSVRIEMPLGTLRFPRDQVERIEFKDTPETQLAKKLAETSLNDPDALLKLARWARENSLNRQAQELYTLILKLEPDHAAARRDQGFVRIDGKWREFDQAVELARSKLEAGQYDTLLKEVLSPMQAAAGTPQRLTTVRELKGEAQLRSKDFAGATETYAQLARDAEGPAAIRSGAIAAILKANPDGMYVLSEPYPPAAVLLGEGDKVFEPGPASLAEPVVLQAALRDLAKKEIEIARKLMAAARQLESSKGESAKAKYFQATKALDRADALVPEITRTYRVEIARRRISSLRKLVAAGAKKFDEAMEKLGRKNISPQAYRKMILRMVKHLDDIRDDLRAILAAAKPYPRDLVLEIKWAELDLARIAEMRKHLVEELNGER